MTKPAAMIPFLAPSACLDFGHVHARFALLSKEISTDAHQIDFARPASLEFEHKDDDRRHRMRNCSG